jgi:NAD(P)-dependent dehydrogenase (short-subunit alcohol dehydrogenase family)
VDYFRDKVAIVTGGASGIGRALCEELSRKGATVLVADINGERANQVASAITGVGGRAHAAHLDVSQSEAVQKLVDETVTTHGRLDFMFNNAGIGILGDARDMELEHWRRIVDVNLWGVVYGTMSAYQVMVRQGFGHIVNTASGGGLIPLPMASAYAASKFGVVGLSTSLRIEAAGLGVKVSVVCPGGIRTDIIETTTLININREKAIRKVPTMRLMDATKCARIVLRGVARNRAIITVTAFARLAWWLYRFQPALLTPIVGKMAREYRVLREET